VEFIRNGLSISNRNGVGGIPITRIETISEHAVDPQRVGYAGVQLGERDEWLLDRGDILFSHINSVSHLGKVALYEGRPEHLLHGMNLLSIRPKTSVVLPQYLVRALRSDGFRAQLSKHIKPAVNQASVSSSALKKLTLRIPDLAEQRRIADILDKTDAIRRKRKEAIALTEELLRSAFLDMFGDPVTNPKGWPVKPLGELADIRGGGTPSRARAEFFAGSIPWATAKDFRSEFMSDAEEHVSEEAIASSATKLVPSGTILVVVKSKILMRRLPVSVSTVPLCFNQDVKGLVVHDPDEVFYVATHLRMAQRKLLELARGVNTEGLTLEHLRSHLVMRPPVVKIRRFATLQTTLRRSLERRVAATQQTEELFNTLVARAFSGSL
jgi:type I restriction enzyme S subunit